MPRFAEMNAGIAKERCVKVRWSEDAGEICAEIVAYHMARQSHALPIPLEALFMASRHVCAKTLFLRSDLVLHCRTRVNLSRISHYRMIYEIATTWIIDRCLVHTSRQWPPAQDAHRMSFGPHLLLATLEGLVNSAVLALTALGLSLVFGVMRVVNVAHGEFFMLGAVLAWWVAIAGRRPSGARLSGCFGCRAADRRRDRAGLRAAGAATAQLQSGSHHRRHHRPALHHPAAGADLLRAGGAAGRGAVQLPHPAALVRLFRLQAVGDRRLGGAAALAPGSC